MLTYYTLNAHHQVIPTDKNNEFCWIHVDKPSMLEIETLTSEYHFPKDYLTAVLDDDEISRVEGLNQLQQIRPILALVQSVHETVSANGYPVYDTFPISLIIIDDLVITASKYPLVIDNYQLFNDIISKSVNKSRAIALTIAYQAARKYHKYINKLKKAIADIEMLSKKSTDNDVLYQLMNCQKSFIKLEISIKTDIIVIDKLIRTGLIFEENTEKNVLNDILVELQQALSTTKTQLRIIESISDMFSAIVSNNLNLVMKILTSMTIVLTVPTIVSGIYGMNVDLPFSDSPFAFLIISLTTILLCMVIIRFLKKGHFF